MKVPMEWLQEYVEVDIPVEELCNRMIMHGLGVEGVTQLFDAYQGVVVGKILAISQHEHAERLRICRVDAGLEKECVVLTAASNVYDGMICPVALQGTTLPNGKSIEAEDMRGVVSQGMFCSGKELCVVDADIKGASVDGILDMGSSYGTHIGENFFTAIGINSPVIEFEVYANRGDCMSVVGIAREVAAALGVPFHWNQPLVKELDTRASQYASVEIQDDELCSRYIARILTDIKVEDSPLWMQRRLMGAGVRPISNMVDITNYVMMELGYPMHAFDYGSVPGGNLIVRRAREGEKLVTLDGREHLLDTSTLVIANTEQPIGLAGVMGGQNSEITEKTTMVFLESAKFDGANNRRTSRALGIMSEAAMRFTKGIDAEGIQQASDRAAQLMDLIGCGKVLAGRVDSWDESPIPSAISLRMERVNRVLGTDLPIEVMTECLLRENIQVQEQGEGRLLCTIPAYRTDLSIEEDLIEEIAKVYGYDAIPTRELSGRAQGGYSPVQKKREQVRNQLSAMGLYETVSLSFLGNQLLDKMHIPADDMRRSGVWIHNPLSEEYGMMRATLLPSMAQTLAVNLRNRNTQQDFFEISNIHYQKREGELLPQERATLVIGGTGEGFLRVKGYLTELFDSFSATGLQFVAGGPGYYHPGRKALIYFDGIVIGDMGELHPDVIENFEMMQRGVIAEIDLSALYHHATQECRYLPISRYPVVERDIAVVVDEKTPVGEMMDVIRQTGGVFLKELALFDIYQGEHIAEGKKSIAFSLGYQVQDHTLTGEEIGTMTDEILQTLAHRFQAVLRT